MAYIGFKKLKSKLAGKVRNPGAVAASIGRKKYGKKRFQHLASSGKTALEAGYVKRAAAKAAKNSMRGR